METINHIVEFVRYCGTCKHRDVKDDKGEEPCHTCLDHPVNMHTTRPYKYEKDEGAIEVENRKKEKTKKDTEDSSNGQR